VQLKKKVRGVRPIEREVEGKDDPEARAVRGYCAVVRSAITDDGRPPLEASGLKLHERLRRLPTAWLGCVAAAVTPVKRGSRLLNRLERLVRRGLDETAGAWGPIRRTFDWVHRVARVLKNEPGLGGREVRRRCSGLLGAMRRHRARCGELAAALDHFRSQRQLLARPVPLLRQPGPATNDQ
jgi:hypothetical protein